VNDVNDFVGMFREATSYTQNDTASWGAP